MADKLPLEEPLRRAIEANLRYYEALGQVTQEYVKALFGVMQDLPIRIGPGTAKARPATQPAAQPAARPASTASASAATLVLEAAAGDEAQGVFLVENKLSRTVSTAVMTSAFADPSGRAIQPALRIVPSVVTLEPGHRTLVQVFAQVTDELDADVPYRGEVSVPGLSDHSIPVVLRRKPASPALRKRSASAKKATKKASTRKTARKSAKKTAKKATKKPAAKRARKRKSKGS